MSDVTVDIGPDFVAEIEIHRPPNNFLDIDLIVALADTYDELDGDPRCRAIVLCAEGKHFCAGAQFSSSGDGAVKGAEGGSVSAYSPRLFATRTPVVAAVQGAAIGGGLGLACSADFRVTCPEARFAANFARIGFHHGFALTVTLPLLVGHQRAIELLYTGRRITGEEAFAMGMADRLVDAADVRAAAHELAAESAASAPLAVRSIKATMRTGVEEAVKRANEIEFAEQERTRQTKDFAEGVAASAERRPAQFIGA